MRKEIYNKCEKKSNDKQFGFKNRLNMKHYIVWERHYIVCNYKKMLQPTKRYIYMLYWLSNSMIILTLTTWSINADLARNQHWWGG